MRRQKYQKTRWVGNLTPRMPPATRGSGAVGDGWIIVDLGFLKAELFVCYIPDRSCAASENGQFQGKRR